MSWNSIIFNIGLMLSRIINIMDQTYKMIVNNTLLFVFVIVFALFVGIALLKRLIHI